MEKSENNLILAYFRWYFVGRETVLHRWLISTHTECPVSDYQKSYFYHKQPWRTDTVPFWGAKGGQAYCPLKEIQVPFDQGFFLIMHLTVCRHPSGLICITPVGLRGKENWHKYADTHSASVFDPAIFIYCQPSWKLWQRDFLACKRGKVSDS